MMHDVPYKKDDFMTEDYKGLSGSEVSQRVEEGKVNTTTNSISRTKKEIFRAHLCTFFNFLNVFLGALVLMTGQIKNLTFMFTIIANSVIGIIQELKVKSLVDKLSVITASKATVIRDGTKKQIPLDELVVDDVMVLESGDQIGADCVVLEAQGIEVNESMITGESVAVKKHEGDEMLSGSFLVAGSGVARVIHVGSENYATILAAKAKDKKRATSEMQDSIGRIIKIVGFLIVPVLSRQSTFTRASASMASISCTNACFLARRPTPRIKETLVRRTRPSGIIPMTPATVLTMASDVLVPSMAL